MCIDCMKLTYRGILIIVDQQLYLEDFLFCVLSTNNRYGEMMREKYVGIRFQEEKAN